MVTTILLAPSARAEAVDRIVAVVGDRVVTLWDLQLEQLLGERMPCPESVLCDPVQPLQERLVDRALVRGLAGDTPTYRPSTEDVELRLIALRGAFPRPEDFHDGLAGLGLSEGDLAGLLFSRMVVERYVHRHVALPVHAAGGGPEDYSERYEGWILEQREQVRIRVIEPEEAP